MRVLDFETRFAGVDAALLAGNFNSPPDDETYQAMTAAVTEPDSVMVGFNDMGPKEKRYGNEITFIGFCHESDPKRIDFIFSREDRKIKYGIYAVLANRFDIFFRSSSPCCRSTTVPG